MNNIIKQLSQIEERSVQILDEGAARRQALTAEYEEKTRIFEEELNKETEEKITALKNEMGASMHAQLDKQKEDADVTAARLEKHYESRHSNYVDVLFKKMTEV